MRTKLLSAVVNQVNAFHNLNRSSPRLGERCAWRGAVEKYGVVCSDCGDYAVLGHKFIIRME